MPDRLDGARFQAAASSIVRIAESGWRLTPAKPFGFLVP